MLFIQRIYRIFSSLEIRCAVLTLATSLLIICFKAGHCTRLLKVSYECQHSHTVRLICVPKFRETATVVLCDFTKKDYPCYLLRFS
jgi:hypothetical protein